ncbi:hypothetical protein LCGC14_0312770 [marine sediment metagenome]|uniref:Uncharacterized protein n=1 Tax=marine sediment metagenome TaxID=412755 RepID=A0A0F9TLI4_9ZZZZ
MARHSHRWKNGYPRHCRCGAQITLDERLVLLPEHVEELRTVWLRPGPMPDWAQERLRQERVNA